MSATPRPEIPHVDFSPVREQGLGHADARPVLEALHAACAGIGFVTISGHGVPDGAIRGIVGAAHEFFALPDDAKLEVAPRRWNPASPNVYRGYFPASANGKEGLDIGDPALAPDAAELLARPHYELNRFPPALEAGWHAAVERYFEALARFGRSLMEAMVAALGGDPARIAGPFARPRSASTLRFNHYPGLDAPVETSAEDGVPLACETHVDSGVLTILYQDGVGGLQVRDRERRWRDVPFDPDAFVVNTGLAFQHLSGRVFAATPHRVLHSPTPRLSIPFFYEPAHDFPVSPRSLGLAGGDREGEPASYEAFLKSSLQKFPEYQRDA